MLADSVAPSADSSTPSTAAQPLGGARPLAVLQQAPQPQQAAPRLHNNESRTSVAAEHGTSVWPRPSLSHGLLIALLETCISDTGNYPGSILLPRCCHLPPYMPSVCTIKTLRRLASNLVTVMHPLNPHARGLGSLLMTCFVSYPQMPPMQ